MYSLKTMLVKWGDVGGGVGGGGSGGGGVVVVSGVGVADTDDRMYGKLS